MLRSMFYMATAVLLSTTTAESGSYLKTEERKKASSSYRYTRYQVFPNYRTLEPHVTCILERIVDWYCTTSMIAHERKKLEKDDILNYPPPVGTIACFLIFSRQWNLSFLFFARGTGVPRIWQLQDQVFSFLATVGAAYRLLVGELEIVLSDGAT